jgi:SAM-dependent methyltransferase
MLRAVLAESVPSAGREQRLVFGEAAELYDRARPGYPDELIDDVLAIAGGVTWMLDAGCGTGKAAVQFAAGGIRGVGVEPDPNMAAVARRHLAGSGWRVDVASFEAWQPAPGDAPLDLVCSAQAWHWFEPQERLRKARALLRPGGWLALWWNGPADFESDTRLAIDAVYAELAPEIGHRGRSGGGMPELEPAPGFGEPVRRDYRWARSYTTREWLDLLRTQSDHRMLPADRRESLIAAVGSVIDAHGGVYRHPYVCRLWAAPATRAASG